MCFALGLGCTRAAFIATTIHVRAAVPWHCGAVPVATGIARDDRVATSSERETSRPRAATVFAVVVRLKRINAYRA